MTEPKNRVYRKKHFYKVTWTRSDKLLSEVPWLNQSVDYFCMIGYRQPTLEEAEKFIGDKMYDRLFDKVVAVEEISKDIALYDFNMDNWRSWKVFAADEKRKPSLMSQIQSAEKREAGSCLNPDAKNLKHNIER